MGLNNRGQLLLNAFWAMAMLVQLSCRTEAQGQTVDPREEMGQEDPYAPPKTWVEDWFEHNQKLELVYVGDHLALYYDKDVDRSVEWPKTYLDEVWKYIKSVYGPFGDDPRLYTILHTNKYPGGHPSTYMDESHDYRNVVDCGPYDWMEPIPDSGLSMMIHEIAHIVEGSANGLQYNPAWDIWKDSKWAEIFVYDVYKNTGKDEFASYTYQDFMDNVDDYPSPGTHWFRDWFFPIYDRYGENRVLNGFYDLLALYFPKHSSGTRFARRMNMGEFVHFWSGAAGIDLLPLAKNAFGWSTEWDGQLMDAQSTFNQITY